MDEKQIDKELEKDMDEVLEIVVMGRACRNAANIKNRQPIGKHVCESSGSTAGLLPGYHPG